MNICHMICPLIDKNNIIAHQPIGPSWYIATRGPQCQTEEEDLTKPSEKGVVSYLPSGIMDDASFEVTWSNEELVGSRRFIYIN